MKILKYNIIILLSLFITGCIPPEQYDRFSRQNRTSSYFKKNYKPIDTINIIQIKICKLEKEILRKRLKTNGKIDISTKPNTIENWIINSMKKNFKNVKYEFRNDTIWDKGCNYLKKGKGISDYYKNSLMLNNNYSIELTLNIELVSSKNHEVGLNFTPIFEGDRHDIISTMRIAIIDKNELIFMDNIGNYSKLISNRNDKVTYEISEKIIDSLVNRSLAEYHKRIE